MLFCVNNIALAAKGIPIKDFRLFSDIGMSFEHNDNVLQQPTNEVSSFVTVLTPQVTLERRKRANTYSLTLKPEIGRYFSSSADNYDDLQLSATADWQLSRLAGLTLGGQYQKEHDERGSTDRLDSTKPFQWHETSVNGLFNYGRSNAKLRIELEWDHLIKRYDELFVEDKDQTGIAARFFYRLLPKTRLFFEAHHTIIDYQLATSTQDSDLFNYSIGATWFATKKTTGKAKLGYLTKDFSSSERDHFSGISWEAAVQWIPMSRSVINISTRRYPYDATGVGDYLLTQDFSVVWKHRWKPRISTIMGVHIVDTDFGGNTGSILRADDTNNLNFLINYHLRKWLSINMGGHLMKRDSNHDDSDFDRMRWLVVLKVSI